MELYSTELVAREFRKRLHFFDMKYKQASTSEECVLELKY